jgi:hypothetical protein
MSVVASILGTYRKIPVFVAYSLAALLGAAISVTLTAMATLGFYKLCSWGGPEPEPGWGVGLILLVPIVSIPSFIAVVAVLASLRRPKRYDPLTLRSSKGAIQPKHVL